LPNSIGQHIHETQIDYPSGETTSVNTAPLKDALLFRTAVCFRQVPIITIPQPLDQVTQFDRKLHNGFDFSP
jgi:hypothetical protein